MLQRTQRVFNLLESRPLVKVRIRGHSGDSGRQLVLRDDEFDIHIKIWTDETGRRIHGQLLPRGGKEFAQPVQCHLLHGGARFQSTRTDETGEFNFNEVPEVGLTLQVDLPDVTIVGSLDIPQTN